MFSFELVFMCFVIYYIVEEVMEIKKVKLEYFNSAWNIMDCVLIVISLFNILIAVYTEFVVTAVLKVSLTFACILAIYTLYRVSSKTVPTWLFALLSASTHANCKSLDVFEKFKKFATR